MKVNRRLVEVLNSFVCFFIVEGFIESQIDHLKRVQTKLTLFSLQSDKCVSKVWNKKYFFVMNNLLKLI